MRRNHICVTGTIGSGKSYISKLFSSFGYLLFDADKVVHGLLATPDVIAAINVLSPESVKKGKIDRKALGADVFQNPHKLQKLEDLLHPLVGQERAAFTAECERRRKSCVFEIPLYFEAGLNYENVAVVVTTAPLFLLKERAMRRPGMTEEKFAQILSRQWSDAEKQKRADFVVHTGLSKGYSWQQVECIVKQLEKKNVRS